MSQPLNDANQEDDKREAARKRADRAAVTRGLTNPVTIHMLQAVGDASKEKRAQLKKAHKQDPASYNGEHHQEAQKSDLETTNGTGTHTAAIGHQNSNTDDMSIG